MLEVVEKSVCRLHAVKDLKRTNVGWKERTGVEDQV